MPRDNDSPAGFSGSDTTDNSVAVLAKVSVKIPPFWKPNVKLWFQQIESQFLTSGITTDATKFHTIVSAIESSILAQVSDIVLDPPTVNMYTTLKDRLIKQFADSEHKRLKQLLLEIDLGDKKPSQLLREMRELGGNTVSEDLLKSLWMQRLPEHMRTILTAGDEELSKMVRIADSISEVSDRAYISETKKNSTDDRYNNLEKQVAELSAQIAILNQNYRRSRSQSRSSSRSNRSTSFSNDKYCWFHQKFREAAKRCRSPCEFKSENSTARR